VRLALHERIVHPLFDPVIDQSLAFKRGRVFFLQVNGQGFPLGQFGVTKNRVLDYLISLVFCLHSGRLPIGFRGTDKIAQRRIDQSRLSI